MLQLIKLTPTSGTGAFSLTQVSYQRSLFMKNTFIALFFVINGEKQTTLQILVKATAVGAVAESITVRSQIFTFILSMK